MTDKKKDATKKKVAIVGLAPHYILAPFDDPSFEIWGLNNGYQFEGFKRWDRWFQLHDLRFYDAGPKADPIPEILQRYASWECPVYMFDKYLQVPNAIRFPYEKLIEEFGTYFNNSISWMIAFAIHEGFEEIHIYGVDMAVGTEYSEQRPSCEYFIGLARGRGIKVYMPEESRLLKTKYIYGCQVEEETAYKKQQEIRKNTCIKRRDEAEAQEMNYRDMKNQFAGAILAINEALREL